MSDELRHEYDEYAAERWANGNTKMGQAVWYDDKGGKHYSQGYAAWFECIKYPFLRQRIAELEAEKEAMKCCGNCKNQGLGLDGMPRCDISTEIGGFPCTDDLEYWQPKERTP